MKHLLLVLGVCLPAFVVAQGTVGRVELLRSTGGLPAHIAGMFSRPAGFQRAATGEYWVFDRGPLAQARPGRGGATLCESASLSQSAGLKPCATDTSPPDRFLQHATDTETPRAASSVAHCLPVGQPFRVAWQG